MVYTFIDDNSTSWSWRKSIIFHEDSASADGQNTKVLFRIRSFAMYKGAVTSINFLVTITYPRFGSLCTILLTFTRELPCFKNRGWRAISRGEIQHDTG
jgi:hypothetical protein